MDEKLELKGVYTAQCFDANGDLKWEDKAYNQTTFQAKNAMLTGYLAAGAVPAQWYCSLITAGTETTAGTYLLPIVTEVTTASNTIANRVLMTWGAATGGVLASATVTFPIIGANTITGNMVVSGGLNIGAVGNTSAPSGILFSAGTFTGGPKTVGIGDTLNVSYSVSV